MRSAAEIRYLLGYFLGEEEKELSFRLRVSLINQILMLIYCWKAISNLEDKKFIEDKIFVLLKDVSDFQTLKDYYLNCVFGSSLEKIIDNRMAEVLEADFSKDICLKRLISCYWITAPQKTSNIALNKIKQVLETTFDLKFLYSCFIGLLNPVLKELIEKRIEELLKTKRYIPLKIEGLFSCWSSNSLSLVVRNLAEIRIHEALNKISKNNIPEWFIYFLGNKERVPDFMKEDFIKKVNEIYKVL